MKQFFLGVAVMVAATHSSYAQRVEATVIDAQSREPIEYASVGVVERTLGTLADTMGHFSLDVPMELDGDSLRISCVGYGELTMSVADARKCTEIALDAVEYPLPEVVVMPIKTTAKHYGRKSAKGSMFLVVEGDSGAGKEMGMQFKTKKRAWIKNVSFAIVENDSMLTRMPFRLNLYKKQGNEYTNNLVSSLQFLYTKEVIVDGRFTFNLPTSIVIEKGEYIIAVEFLENFPNHNFHMRTGIMTGHTYYRYAPQSSWKKIPLGSTLAIDVAEEE